MKGFAAFPVAITTMCASVVSFAQADKPAHVKIVGVGATSCAQFLADVEKRSDDPARYLAWAQGYMSGVLIGRLRGVDESLCCFPAGIDPVFPRRIDPNPRVDFRPYSEQTARKHLVVSVTDHLASGDGGFSGVAQNPAPAAPRRGPWRPEKPNCRHVVKNTLPHARTTSIRPSIPTMLLARRKL